LRAPRKDLLIIFEIKHEQIADAKITVTSINATPKVLERNSLSTSGKKISAAFEPKDLARKIPPMMPTREKSSFASPLNIQRTARDATIASAAMSNPVKVFDEFSILMMPMALRAA
jgi:hypothetical protein